MKQRRPSSTRQTTHPPKSESTQCIAAARVNEDKLKAATSLYQTGQISQAEAACKDILQLQPLAFDALHLLAAITVQKGDHAAAINLFDRALDINPNQVTALNNRGVVLISLGREEEALESYDRALKAEPDNVNTLNNRGIALGHLGRHGEALACFMRASQIKPDYVEAINNCGTALRHLNRYEEALDCCDSALRLAPDYAEALNNRGIALLYLRRHKEAIASYELAGRLKPEYADAHWHESICRLLVGDFVHGWQKYEWRWKTASGQKCLRNFNQPLWLGKEDIRNRYVLLHSEQGLGDTIQFCRYVKQVADLGAKVILEVHPSLTTLLKNLTGVTTILGQGENLPYFEYHCPLLSLPLALGVNLDNITGLPYLKADAQKIDTWKSRLKVSGKKRVGLVWNGSGIHKKDCDERLVTMKEIEVLVDNQADYYCLQKELRYEDRAVLQQARNIVYFADELVDFSDTSALIELMDVVITVDTSVAHLAGAMGKEVWVLLSFNPDWRWFLDRSNSPWYHSVRLFRQSRIGDWSDVLMEVRNTLTAYLTNTHSQGFNGQNREQPLREGEIENSINVFNNVAETKYGSMVYNQNDVYVGGSLAAYGEFSEGETALFDQLVKAGHIVVDAGANIGPHTIHLSRLVGETGAVYAFEPQRLTFQALCANLALNQCSNVFARQQMLGHQSGEMVLLNVGPGIKRGNSFGELPFIPNRSGEKIDIVTIDSLELIRCDLIKANVDGMEEEVIAGAFNTIAKFRPNLYLKNDRVEKSASLIRFLQSLNYRMWWHLPPLFNPNNYAKNTTNIFSDEISINILCQPAEFARPVSDLHEIKHTDVQWNRQET